MVHLFLNHIDYPIWITSEGLAAYNFDYRREIGIQVVDTCPNPPCLWGPLCDYSTAWTEGMGSGMHFLYPEIGKDSCVSNGYLLECFWHNGQYVYGGSFCDYHTGIKENLLDNSVQFFVVPNPVSDVSIFDLSGLDATSVSIFNLFGQKIKFYDSGKKFIAIHAAQFENGSYFLKALSKKGDVFFTKFTVIK